MDDHGDRVGRCSGCGTADDLPEPYLAIVKGDTGAPAAPTAGAATPEQVVARALGDAPHELGAWTLRLCPGCARRRLDATLGEKQHGEYETMLIAPFVLAGSAAILWVVLHNLDWLGDSKAGFIMAGMVPAAGVFWGFFSGPFAVMDFFRYARRRAAGPVVANDTETAEVYAAEACRILAALEASEEVPGDFDLPGASEREVLGVGATADDLGRMVPDEWRATVWQALRETTS